MFAATLTAEAAFALPERLNNTLAVVEACRDYHTRMQPCMPGVELEAWRWHKPRPAITAPSSITEAWASPTWGSVSLEGAPGLLWVYPHQIRLSADSKLGGFATDHEGCQVPIRQVCRAIAYTLETNRVLYLPDSGDWPSEVGDVHDCTFDQALARLAAWGPPVSEIGALGYGHGLRLGFHYADGALRRPDGTPVPEDEIIPGRGWISSGGITRYPDGQLVPAEELGRPHLHGGFVYYIDDFHDLA